MHWVCCRKTHMNLINYNKKGGIASFSFILQVLKTNFGRVV